MILVGLPLSGGPIFCQNGNCMTWWLIQQGESGLAKIIRLVQNYGKNSAILSPHFAGMRITEKRQKYLSYLLRMDAFQRPAWMFKAKPI